MNLSSKQFVYVQLSSKKFIDVQTFHPFLTFIHVHVEKYFPRHSYVTHRDFLRIFCPCHQNIPNIFVIAHKLMFMFTCLLPSVVVFEIIHVLINFAPKKKCLCVTTLQPSRFTRGNCILIILIQRQNMCLTFSKSSKTWLFAITTL
jgi:hypothetical protein